MFFIYLSEFLPKTTFPLLYVHIVTLLYLVNYIQVHKFTTIPLYSDNGHLFQYLQYSCIGTLTPMKGPQRLPGTMNGVTHPITRPHHRLHQHLVNSVSKSQSISPRQGTRSTGLLFWSEVQRGTSDCSLFDFQRHLSNFINPHRRRRSKRLSKLRVLNPIIGSGVQGRLGDFLIYTHSISVRSRPGGDDSVLVLNMSWIYFMHALVAASLR